MLALLLALGLGLISGCWNRSVEQEAAEPLGGRLYQLQQGTFAALNPEQGIPATRFQPWTVQGRVSDAVSLEDRIYLGVNGYGIAQLTFGVDGEPELQYFYDSMGWEAGGLCAGKY